MRVNCGEAQVIMLLQLWHEAICTQWAEKLSTKLLVAILVVWLLLSGFCLTHEMHCDCNIEEKALLLLHISKWLRRDTILPLFMRSYWWRRRLCKTPDKVWAFTHYRSRCSRMKKYRHFHSIVSLPSNFEIHTNKKFFSSMSQS